MSNLKKSERNFAQVIGNRLRELSQISFKNIISWQSY